LERSSSLGLEGNYGLQVLWEDGERAFCRGSCVVDAEGSRNTVLAVLLTAEHPSPFTLERLAHEYELKDELDRAWAVRPLELVREGGRNMLVLEHPGGEPLEGLLGTPMALGGFLCLAISVAAALGRVHQHGLVHKDIKPAQILVNCTDGGVRFTGFGLASRLPRERQAPEPPETIAGTLAYMAPEQTGRMNRSIDARSDLYALGVTFYQMLTGALPFTAADPMEWVHCHIAKRPAPPSTRLETIPEAVSELLMKLLAKSAEERYQTAAGVEQDLRRCLAQWETDGRIDDFPLGERDVPDRLLIPEKLYGRAREVETLLAMFDRVVKNGAPELVVVSGYSGIGKSSVVNELHKVLVPRHGLFASGKFDQYKRNIPYSTLVQAFQSLVRPLLGKSDTELGIWRGAFLEALEPNARLMTDLIPELKLIIGEQPPVPELDPQQAQGRFRLVFSRLIGVFARPEHPLALFLDDLQWLDGATLDLLEDLLIRSDLQHLMLIGAYRDNEVDAVHPLARKLAAIRQVGARVQEICLAPLTRDDLGQLMADALRCEPPHGAPLVQLVHEKTEGNPFFVIQFLQTLAEESLLQFDHDGACWSWDLDRIHAKGYTDNVVELMVGKVNRLPIETQLALQKLACLGNIASVAMVSIVLETPEAQVHAMLWPAVRQELIERQEGSYKFIHDRVQEAAYSLIPEESRAAAHLRIGRLQLAQMPPEQREEAIFDIVNQLNRGAALITQRKEWEQLAELNLTAGKRAKGSGAYVSALTYLNAGAALLAEDSWEHRHELTFALDLNRAECEFLTGQMQVAEERLAALSKRAATTVERAIVACLHIDVYTTLDESGRAVAVGLNYLRHVGIEWSSHPQEDEVRLEYERIWSLLGGRQIEDLIDLPPMDDPESLATDEVLIKLLSPARYTDANLASLTICKAVSLSLERGNCDASSVAYVRLGRIAGPRFGDYQVGFRFGQLGYDLVERRGLKRFEARTYFGFAIYVVRWMKNVRACRDLLRRAFAAAKRTGDLTYAAYSCCHINSDHLFAGEKLPGVQGEAEDSLAYANKASFGLVTDNITTQLAFIRMLRGVTPKFGCFDDAQFNELRTEEYLSCNPALAMSACWYWIRKLQARYLAGDYTTALDAASKAQILLWTTASFFEEAEYHFYGALTQAACCDSVPASARQPHFDAVAAHHRQLLIWAENCPENFESHAELVGAEIARIEGRNFDAIRLYEQAIRSARANGFVHNEALANEIAARFYAERSFDKIARVYLQDARYGYLRWGADGKVRQLDEIYPHLRDEEPAHTSTSTIGTPVANLDLATVIKVSQTVSSEIVVEKLLDKLMRTAIAHAGAERGLLILLRGDEPRIEAEATTGGDTISVQLRDQSVTAAVLPESVLHYVMRTRESVILDDAIAQPAFAADPYLRQTHVRSVLGLPLIKQARLIGVLYLENNLASHVFTPARISVLELLASQAAISLENAGLYADLRVSEERWRNLFENVPVGVTLTGPDGRYIAANQTFLELTGYSEAELRHLSPVDLTHEDDRPDAVAILAARAAGKPYRQHVEKRYRRRDGSVIWVDSSAFVAPVVAGAPVFAAAVIDITDRKRAEEELRRSEASLARAQQISHTGSWRWNVGTGEVSASAEFLQILGFDPATTQPSYTRVMGRIHPEDRPAFEQVLDQAARDRSRFQHEYRIALPDGSVKYLQNVGQPDSTDPGDLEFVGAVMDVTERKADEEALRNAQAELARVARLTTMGELVASIAHEINQPLAAVVSSGSASLRWLNREMPNLDRARDGLSRIVQDARRASDVIRSLRALVKKSGAQLTELDIRDTIEEVLALTRSELQRHGVVLRADLAGGDRPVLGDRVQLQQVLLNLIMNGIQAMGAVADGRRELTVSVALAEPDRVLVAVEDTGPGLDPAIAQRVFEPFFTTRSDGLGMGLSICRSIIEAHGGQLRVSPRAPHGTAFHFTIPIAVEK
jgi:PAS domain S-box-containing protein